MKPKDIIDCPGAWYIDCPGAWYGNTPKPEWAGQGHIIVDPAKIREALTWLARRYFVGATKLTTDGGIAIDVQLKPSASSTSAKP